MHFTDGSSVIVFVVLRFWSKSWCYIIRNICADAYTCCPFLQEIPIPSFAYMFKYVVGGINTCPMLLPSANTICPAIIPIAHFVFIYMKAWYGFYHAYIGPHVRMLSYTDRAIHTPNVCQIYQIIPPDSEDIDRGRLPHLSHGRRSCHVYQQQERHHEIAELDRPTTCSDHTYRNYPSAAGLTYMNPHGSSPPVVGLCGDGIGP